MNPRYPDSVEREFQRVTNGYMRLLNQTLKEYMPEIMDAYKAERRRETRYDDIRDLTSNFQQIFMKIAQALEQKLSQFDLERKVRNIANMTKSRSIREWKRLCKKTLGIDLMSDYYKGDFYEAAIRLWIDENVLKIKSIPNDTLGAMHEIILEGFRNGRTIKDISKEIQNEYNVTKRKAQMLARDQLGTLNAQLTRMQQQDAGCKKYRWSDSRDSRVRDCHKDLNGKLFSWDDPPEMWYETKRGRVYTGRKCHPGEDFLCRCCAIPEFNLETIDVPMQASPENQGGRSI